MDIGLLARLTVGLCLGGFVGWFGGLLLGLTASSVPTTVVLRTALSLAIIAIVARILIRRTYASPRLLPTVATAAVASYAISPTAWAGRSLISQLVVDPGVVTILVDGLLWVGVVLLAARSVEPRPAPAEYRPYA